MIKKIFIDKKLIDFINQRQLTKQYKKAKLYILCGDLKQVDFKLRQPKQNGIYQFKINDQYRAFCKVYGNVLKIFEIYDHKR